MTNLLNQLKANLAKKKKIQPILGTKTPTKAQTPPLAPINAPSFKTNTPTIANVNTFDSNANNPAYISPGQLAKRKVMQDALRRKYQPGINSYL